MMFICFRIIVICNEKQNSGIIKGVYMHLQFLIEDCSSEKLIIELMKKYLNQDDNTFDCKPFHGIGGFPKKK